MSQVVWIFLPEQHLIILQTCGARPRQKVPKLDFQSEFFMSKDYSNLSKIFFMRNKSLGAHGTPNFVHPKIILHIRSHVTLQSIKDSYCP